MGLLFWRQKSIWQDFLPGKFWREAELNRDHFREAAESAAFLSPFWLHSSLQFYLVRLQSADRCNLLCVSVRTITIVSLPSALVYLVMAIVVLVLLGLKRPPKIAPKFSLGGTLMRIVIGWSDAEGKRLKAAIGDELASELLRGCLVHWECSWVRIQKRVISSDPFHKAVESKVFSKIAASIPKQAKQSDVVKCFEALCSNRKIKDICSLVQGIMHEDAKLVDKHACLLGYG